MKFYDAEHLMGTEITPHGMGHKFHEALSTRGPEDNPGQPLKNFLFFNALAIIDYLKLGTD